MSSVILFVYSYSIASIKIPLGRTATIEEVASAYIFLMMNTFITGQKIAVDGGIMLA
nr:SDR family oxidoreductase [uncultured Carboxylicivirga sp.]